MKNNLKEIKNKEYTLIFYDIPPSEIRGNSRTIDPIKRRVNRERRDVAMSIGLEAKGMNDPIERVEVSYYFHHIREIDLDNLIIGMKSTMDGIIDSQIITDDKPSLMEYGKIKFIKLDMCPQCDRENAYMEDTHKNPNYCLKKIKDIKTILNLKEI